MPAERTAKKGRRLTVAGLIAVSAATVLMFGWAVFPTAAFADGTVNWTGNGSANNVPCEESETPGFHWIFTTGGGTSNVTSASLFVNGNGPFPMSPNPSKTQWDADVVSGEVVSAHVNFVGTLGRGNAVLTISHGCFEEETTTTETTSTETTETETTSTETTETETTSSSTTPPSSSTTPPSSSTTETTPTSVSGTSVTPPGSSSTPPEGTSVLPTTVTPGGTAFTGIENVVPLGAIALMLMTGGSGLMWAGSRRRRNDGEDEE